MPPAAPKHEVYLELGTKRAFACAVDWPGWARSGKGEDGALQALVDYWPRYRKALRRRTLGFEPPGDGSAFRVVERIPGNTTTDFGAPGVIPAIDGRSFDRIRLDRHLRLLRACWAAFDRTAAAAAGTELRKGPRGGGRDLDAIVRHVVEAEIGYLGPLGGAFRPTAGDPSTQTNAVRRIVLETLTARARGEPPARVRRSTKPLWPAPFGIRRIAWHALDHAWEIEDRSAPE
ncbi:MAG TPA: hypothetical protein VF972_00820 [Actinomycetota bacterium]